MDKQRAEEFLKINEQKPLVAFPGLSIQFARMGMEDVDRIEKMSDNELINEWLATDGIISQGSCSVSDMQELTLLEMEMESRGITEQDIKGDKND